MRVIPTVLFSAVLFSAVGCGGGSGKTDPAVPTTPPAPSNMPPAPEGWEWYQGTGFTTLAPKGVKPHARSSDKSDPLILRISHWDWQTKDEFGVMVRVYKITPELVTKFESSSDAAWDEFQALTSTQQEMNADHVGVTVGGLPGREKTYTIKPTQHIHRVFRKGDVVYSLSVWDKTVDKNDPKVKAFFDNFKID